MERRVILLLNMTSKEKAFYITTSIAYTNASPHLGFALELIQADVLARYHRALGEEVFFLTGTDEHGQKIAKASGEAGKDPKDFTDEISKRFKDLKGLLSLSNDDFIRTSDQERHWPAVEKFWLALRENGDIYKKKYQGLYCVGCEAFITNKDLVDGKCKNHQKEPEIIEEENYFFRLSKYSKEIEEALESNRTRIIPEGRKNEMLSFIRQGLEDVSFSRPRKDLKWGIPVPEDDTQTIYVWADALVNYLSALGYPDERYKKCWPADVHCLGKDILRFHSTIWLGMLLSLKLPLPENIFVHGFITSDGQKMSKSLGNVIDPFQLVGKYGADPVRYFLCREITPTEDGDFTYEKFEQRYNSDLAKGLGNLVSRVANLAKKYSLSSVASPNGQIEKEISTVRERYHKAFSEFKFNEALMAIWDLISFCDRYIEKEKPWEEKENSKEVVSGLVSAVLAVTDLCQPFLPLAANDAKEQMEGKEIKALFPRI